MLQSYPHCNPQRYHLFNRYSDRIDQKSGKWGFCRDVRAVRPQ